MSTFFVQRPGASCPWRSLQEMLRERHEAARQSREADIKQRESDGMPLDDRADWRAEVGEILDGIGPQVKRSDVVKSIAHAHAIAAGGLSSVPEYKPDPEIADVQVRIRALSKADVLDMGAEMASVSYDGDDLAKEYRATSARIAVMKPFVTKALTGLRGLTVDEGTIEIDDLKPDHPEMPELLEVLDRSGILHAIFVAARETQNLSPLARSRFGLPRQSTLASSSAPSVQHSDGQSSGATAGHSGNTSTVTLSENQTPAHGVTSSTTHSSATHSSSTESPVVSQASQGLS